MTRWYGAMAWWYKGTDSAVRSTCSLVLILWYGGTDSMLWHYQSATQLNAFEKVPPAWHDRCSPKSNAFRRRCGTLCTGI
eukprot:1394590-Rhodomonas_salina.1